MRKLLFTALLTAGLGSTAFSADLPYKVAPMPAPVPVSIWDGFYVGIMGGGVWNNSTTNFVGNDIISNYALADGIVPSSLDTKGSGGFVGGTIGYNRQYGAWVLGLELDAAWSNAKKDSTFVFAEESKYPAYLGGGSGQVNVVSTAFNKLDWFGTMRGRVGYLFTPTTLVFVTGGIAVGQVEAGSAHALNIGSYNIATATGVFNDTRAGWTAGAGIEQKFWDRWSIKAEYRHIDLGTANWSASTSLIGIIPVQFNASQELRYDMALVGLNYKW